MTKDEILKYLNYQGKYTKEIKKKLNKLLKKYHPDVNKDDKKTIIVLYQIKKELEEGTLNNNEHDILKGKNGNQSKDFGSYNIKIKKLLDKLINKKNKLVDKIEQLYEKINSNYRKLNKIQDKLSSLEKEENDSNQYLNILFKKNIIIMLIAMILIIILYILNIKYKLAITFIILFILILNFYLQTKIYKTKINNINNYEGEKNKLKEDLKTLKENITVLEKNIGKVRREIHEVNGEIHFYGIHLNDYKYKEYNKEYENDYNRKR